MYASLRVCASFPASCAVLRCVRMRMRLCTQHYHYPCTSSPSFHASILHFILSLIPSNIDLQCYTRRASPYSRRALRLQTRAPARDLGSCTHGPWLCSATAGLASQCALLRRYGNSKSPRQTSLTMNQQINYKQ